MKDVPGAIVGLIMGGFFIIGMTAFLGGLMVWAIKFFLDGVRSLGWM
jgi:hypothetical protein